MCMCVCVCLLGVSNRRLALTGMKGSLETLPAPLKTNYTDQQMVQPTLSLIFETIFSQ